MCSSTVIVVVVRVRVEPDRRPELGEQRDEHAGVAGEPQRLARLAAEQELRELAHPVGRRARRRSARPRRARRRSAFSRIWASVSSSGSSPSCETNRRPRTSRSGSSCEAALRDRPEDAGLEVVAPAERVDELAVGEPTRHRVDREVAAARDRPRRSRPGRRRSRSRAAPARSSARSRGGANSIPAGASSRIARSRAIQAHPDRACRRRRAPRPSRAARARRAARRRRRRERGSRRPSTRGRAARRARRRRRGTRRAPSERDVVLDRLHGAARYASAIASISTSAPAGSCPTSTVERAGGVAPMWLA